MLNIMETQSKNNVEIVGILKELEVEQKSTPDGREYVSCKAVVKVDQEIGGIAVENEIPVKLFSMKMTNNNTVSKVYSGIIKYKDQFTSLAACPEDQPELASKVVLNSAHIDENIWVDPNSGDVRTGFSIGSNFMNLYRGSSEEFKPSATFEISGVVLNKTREINANEEETGRLKVKMAVVRYGDKVDVITLIAANENAVNFIEQNWEDGDTVNVNGAISINQSTKTWEEEQGFGEPIKRSKTETRKELIILGGSPSGLEEAYSYDANDIKNGLAKRQERTEKQKEKSSIGTKRAQTPKSNQFGF